MSVVKAGPHAKRVNRLFLALEREIGLAVEEVNDLGALSRVNHRDKADPLTMIQLGITSRRRVVPDDVMELRRRFFIVVGMYGGNSW